MQISKDEYLVDLGIIYEEDRISIYYEWNSGTIIQDTYSIEDIDKAKTEYEYLKGIIQKGGSK